ncbi:MAG: type II toxin-antitoxin system RelE/ParE family toxin [Planctomycetes bacterium]|nr:type II toxin-antitoxin system RelE/ParE family toxin [Planctomycetota bacterium]
MARLPIDIHPEARLEEDDAFFYYRERSLRAAESFLKELEKARQAIQKSPEAWAAYLHGTRRYRLKRYPYVVVYRVAAFRIEVVAVAHGRRKPGYWADRLKRDE